MDCVVYGLRKFMKLTVGQNPTILTLFFVPPEFRLYDDPLADDLRAMTEKVISRNAAKTFRGYMQDQRERMLGLRGGAHTNRPELVAEYGYDVKYAACYIRLGFQGIELLTTGKLTMPMQDNPRQIVIDIRGGHWQQKRVIEFGQYLEDRLLELETTTELRNRPDTKAVDAFLIEAYTKTWSS